MTSRDRILNAVRTNQPEKNGELPVYAPQLPVAAGDVASRFVSMLETIGGRAYIVSNFDRIAHIIREDFHEFRRVVSGCPELAAVAETGRRYEDPHTLENVDLAILRAHFGVAENAACWITEDLMVERALPFIAQHLALVIRKQDIVPHMHAAYDRIASLGASYGFATFIAGPSKTADIEQSLVLGAHGPRSMTVFVIDDSVSDAGFF